MNILVPSAIMITMDAIYLTLTSSFYNKQIRLIQGSDIKIKIIPTLLIYVIMLFALNYFILREKRPVMDAAILGFTIGSVFELTNIAIFDRWNVSTVLLDSAWSAVLFGLTTFFTYRFFK